MLHINNAIGSVLFDVGSKSRPPLNSGLRKQKIPLRQIGA